MRASDIHLQPFEDRLQVRYRIDGILYDMESIPKKIQDAVTSRIKVMGKLDIAERRLPQDGRVVPRLGDAEVDVRISVVPTNYGERIVMRLLDKSARLYELEEIGLLDEQPRDHGPLHPLHARHHLRLRARPARARRPRSTRALTRINSAKMNVMTIEDPIEYHLAGISQIQVNEKKGLTFASGLRSLLRQDPDIMMVGEVRDVETARIADPGRPDRPPRVHHHPHERRPHRHHAPARHRHRAVPRGLLRARRHRPAPRARDLPGVPRAVRPGRRRPAAHAELLSIDAGPARRTASSARGRGCGYCFGSGYPSRTGHLRDPAHRRRGARADRGARQREPRSSATAFERGFRTLRMDGADKVHARHHHAGGGPARDAAGRAVGLETPPHAGLRLQGPDARAATTRPASSTPTPRARRASSCAARTSWSRSSTQRGVSVRRDKKKGKLLDFSARAQGQGRGPDVHAAARDAAQGGHPAGAGAGAP